MRRREPLRVATTVPAAFGGFSPAGLRFLRDLAKNNDRTWFATRKATYEAELQQPLRALVADATAALHEARVPLGGDPLRAAFRIHRDVRFSADKSPYKTNVGAYLTRDGDRSAPGGLYVHIQPKQAFVAVAFYELDKPQLLRWRTALASEPKRFDAMLRALAKNGVALAEPQGALKRMPRGFEAHAESPLARYFRWSSFMVTERLPDDVVSSTALVDRIVAIAKNAKPLLAYGWSLE